MGTLLFIFLTGLILGIATYAYLLNSMGIVEVKYVVINKQTGESIEVVNRVWINGNIDYNNRPFRFVVGSKVTIEAPEYIDTPWGRAKFSFWQIEESQTYDDRIYMDRELQLIVTPGKQIWWANYYI